MQAPGGKEVPGILIAALLLMIGAGAAAGAATGAINGDSSTEVEQALSIDKVNVDDGNGFGVIGDDETSFVTSAELVQGDEYEIDVDLENDGSDITAKLVFENTDPLHIDVSGEAGIEVGQVGDNEFLLEIEDFVDDGNDAGADEITITVSSSNSIQPGFFEFETKIVPVEPGE